MVVVAVELDAVLDEVVHGRGHHFRGWHGPMPPAQAPLAFGVAGVENATKGESGYRGGVLELGVEAGMELAH